MGKHYSALVLETYLQTYVMQSRNKQRWQLEMKNEVGIHARLARSPDVQQSHVEMHLLLSQNSDWLGAI